jgi:uncharacterized protein
MSATMPAPVRVPAPLPEAPARSRAKAASAIYEGTVFHARREPVAHSFRYRIFMPLLDLDELPELFDGIPLWTARQGRWAPARFRAADHLGGPGEHLADRARDLVAKELGTTPDGPVRLLANPRYWGIGMNPVAFYYLHGSGPGEPVEAMIAEVTNTPWGQRRCYVLDVGEEGLAGDFDKALHVSPFMPMEQSYRWSANEPGEQLRVRLANRQDGRTVFEAGVELRRREITPRAMAGLLLRYPPMTAATMARIYWHAAKLKLKGAPYFRNPSKEGQR